MFHLKIIEKWILQLIKKIYLHGRKLFSGSLWDLKIYNLESELHGADQMWLVPPALSPSQELQRLVASWSILDTTVPLKPRVSLKVKSKWWHLKFLGNYLESQKLPFEVSGHPVCESFSGKWGLSTHRLKPAAIPRELCACGQTCFVCLAWAWEGYQEGRRKLW